MTRAAIVLLGLVAGCASTKYDYLPTHTRTGGALAAAEHGCRDGDANACERAARAPRRTAP